GEEELSGHGACETVLECLAGSREWEYSRDNRANYAMIDQFLNRGELLSAWFDDERHAAYAILGGLCFRNFTRCRDNDAAGSDDRPRALQRVASDRIQHSVDVNVDVTNHIFKSRSCSRSFHPHRWCGERQDCQAKQFR